MRCTEVSGNYAGVKETHCLLCNNQVNADEYHFHWSTYKIHKVLSTTRRDRLKSAPYLRLKNIQRTTIGNIWKIFFQKKIFEIFFSKKSIL